MTTLAMTGALTLLAATLAPQDPLVFAARTGIVLNFVKADSVERFEGALADLRRALETSDNPVRRQQADGWRVYRASEPGPSGTLIFVFVIDPVLRGADYSVEAVLRDAFAEEDAKRIAQAFADSLASRQVFNVEPVASTSLAGKPARKN